MQNSQNLYGVFAEKYGIHLDSNRAIFAKDKNEFMSKATKRIQQTYDADTFAYNPASNGVQPWQLLANANIIVDQLLDMRAYTKVGTPFQQGSFETNYIQYTTRSPNGGVEGYSDFSASQVSDINIDFPMSDVIRLQTVTNWGDLETATLSAAKIDAIASKEYSAMENIAIAQNKLFWFGNVNNAGGFISRIFGMLNSPMLNAQVPVTNGSGASPLWSDKVARGATQDIVNDVVVTGLNALQDQMGGNIDQYTKLILVVSSAQLGTLESTNNFTLTPLVQIQNSLPNLRVVYVPEYEAEGVFQLCVENVMGQDIIKDAFTYKYRGHGIVKQLSSYKQKNSFGSAGFVCLNYAGIVTLSGAY